MDYFKILNLKKEPFSNSPDPDFFFKSRQHVNCLQQLEISFRLRRGLNVVIGDVGTGKTTLCRQIIRKFGDDEDYDIYLILDPHFSNSTEFLKAVAGLFPDCKATNEADDVELKEAIKHYLFKYGVDKSRNIIMIIDEGQKMPDFCLEILREFLNYETNEHKLLQIAIFAQREFEDRIKGYENFSDRISLYHVLEPMNFQDTKAMIDYRIMQSSETTTNSSLFSYPALWEIYRSTGGYPRKIINLCHRSILTMIIQNRTRAGWFLIRSCVKRGVFKKFQSGLRIRKEFILSIGVLLLIIGFSSGFLKINNPWKNIEPAPELSSGAEVSLISETTDNPLKEKRIIKTKPSAETIHSENDIRGGDNNLTNEDKPLPVFLGKIVLQQNETLWRLIIKAYGGFNDNIDYLAVILKNNPHIRNPNYVTEGTVVTVPAIPIKVKPAKKNIWWVKVDEKKSLEEAFQMLRKYNDDKPYVRIVTYWNKNEGLKFAILLAEKFHDEEAAQNRMASLSHVMSAGSKVISTWRKDTIFFSNPYLIGRT